MGHSHGTSLARWCVAILSARETAQTLEATLGSTLAAVATHPAVIDLLVNGNPRTAKAIATHVQRRRPTGGAVSIRVWRLALRDKAHAWNEYVHRIWPGDAGAYFLDGCITVSASALTAMQTRLDASAHALVAAAVPTTGGSAAGIRALMLTHPQIHGSFYGIRADALERLRQAGLRLPLGFYRTDSLLGTLFNFNLDPATHDWDDRRIAVVDEPTWSMPPKSPLNPADVRAQLQRLTRQALGRLEEAAIKELFYDRRAPVSLLSQEPLAFIEEWMRRVPDSGNRPLTRSWLARARMAHIRRRADWALAAEPPVCLFAS